MRSPFAIRHSPFNIQHSTFNIQHSTLVPGTALGDGEWTFGFGSGRSEWEGRPMRTRNVECEMLNVECARHSTFNIQHSTLVPGTALGDGEWTFGFGSGRSEWEGRPMRTRNV